MLDVCCAFKDNKRSEEVCCALFFCVVLLSKRGIRWQNFKRHTSHHRTGDFGPNGPIDILSFTSTSNWCGVRLGLCYGGVVY